MVTIESTENGGVRSQGTAEPVPQLTSATATSSGAAPHPVIFYDGVCGLCNQVVKRMLVIDRRRVFRYAPLQGTTARERLQRLPEAADRNDADGGGWLPSLVVLDESGEHRYSSAVVRILQHLGGVWGILGLLLWAIPRPLRDWGYRVVARNRYRWFGKTDACRLPNSEERECFLP